MAPKELEPGTIEYYDEKLFGVLKPDCRTCSSAQIRVFQLTGLIMSGEISDTAAVLEIQERNEECQRGLTSAGCGLDGAPCSMGAPVGQRSHN